MNEYVRQVCDVIYTANREKWQTNDDEAYGCFEREEHVIVYSRVEWYFKS